MDTVIQPIYIRNMLHDTGNNQTRVTKIYQTQLQTRLAPDASFY